MLNSMVACRSPVLTSFKAPKAGLFKRILKTTRNKPVTSKPASNKQKLKSALLGNAWQEWTLLREIRETKRNHTNRLQVWLSSKGSEQPKTDSALPLQRKSQAIAIQVIGGCYQVEGVLPKLMLGAPNN